MLDPYSLPKQHVSRIPSAGHMLFWSAVNTVAAIMTFIFVITTMDAIDDASYLEGAVEACLAVGSLALLIYGICRSVQK